MSSNTTLPNPFVLNRPYTPDFIRGALRKAGITDFDFIEGESIVDIKVPVTVRELAFQFVPGDRPGTFELLWYDGRRVTLVADEKSGVDGDDDLPKAA